MLRGLYCQQRVAATRAGLMADGCSDDPGDDARCPQRASECALSRHVGRDVELHRVDAADDEPRVLVAVGHQRRGLQVDVHAPVPLVPFGPQLGRPLVVQPTLLSVASTAPRRPSARCCVGGCCWRPPAPAGCETRWPAWRPCGCPSRRRRGRLALLHSLLRGALRWRCERRVLQPQCCEVALSVAHELSSGRVRSGQLLGRGRVRRRRLSEDG